MIESVWLLVYSLCRCEFVRSQRSRIRIRIRTRGRWQRTRRSPVVVVFLLCSGVVVLIDAKTKSVSVRQPQRRGRRRLWRRGRRLLRFRRRRRPVGKRRHTVFPRTAYVSSLCVYVLLVREFMKLLRRSLSCHKCVARSSFQVPIFCSNGFSMHLYGCFCMHAAPIRWEQMIKGTQIMAGRYTMLPSRTRLAHYRIQLQ